MTDLTAKLPSPLSPSWRLALVLLAILTIAVIFCIDYLTSPDSSDEWLYTVEQINIIGGPLSALMLIYAGGIHKIPNPKIKYGILILIPVILAFIAIPLLPGRLAGLCVRYMFAIYWAVLMADLIMADEPAVSR